MKKIFSLLGITLLVLLTSCTQTTQTPQDEGKTQSEIQSPNDTSLNDQDVQEPLKEDLSWVNNEYYPIFDGLETKTFSIRHTSGEATKVSFINSEAKSMKVTITFNKDENTPNFRLNQIIMPDGQSDGPFGIETEYDLTQFWWYTLVFWESLMQWDHWSGEATISITLYGENVNQRNAQ